MRNPFLLFDKSDIGLSTHQGVLATLAGFAQAFACLDDFHSVRPARPATPAGRFHRRWLLKPDPLAAEHIAYLKERAMSSMASS
jgi:hypothetical protein